MRVLILLSLVTLTLTALLKEERAPTFTFMGNDRSVNGLPIISVRFPNGISDSLVLQKFDTGIDLPIAKTKVRQISKRFFGIVLTKKSQYVILS